MVQVAEGQGSWASGLASDASCEPPEVSQSANRPNPPAARHPPSTPPGEGAIKWGSCSGATGALRQVRALAVQPDITPRPARGGAHARRPGRNAGIPEEPCSVAHPRCRGTALLLQVDRPGLRPGARARVAPRHPLVGPCNQPEAHTGRLFQTESLVHSAQRLRATTRALPQEHNMRAQRTSPTTPRTAAAGRGRAREARPVRDGLLNEGPEDPD